MIDLDKWGEIFDSIRRHKLRTFLTALSVWWGIFMLIILLGAGKGLQNSVEHNFRDDAINSIWVYSGKTSESYKGLPVGRYIQFGNENYDILDKEIEGVEHTSGRYYIGGEYVIKRNNKPLAFDIRCVHPGHQYLENTLTIEGRFLNNKDIADYRKVCSIGRLVKEGFFEEDENPIGQHINIKGVDFMVIGVFEDEGHDNEMRKIYLPLTTAQKVFEGQDRIHQLMMTVEEDVTLEESQRIEKEIRERFSLLHKFSPDDKQAIHVRNNMENYQEFQTVFAFIKGFLWFVGIGSIIAGIIGVSNIMLIVVKDRTKEIGIRKALGATPRSIVSMIVQEAVFLTSIAGYLGLLAGFSLIYGINYLLKTYELENEFFRNPEVDIHVVLIALFMLVICGALSGLIPAIQAVRINPVVAMKS